MTPRFIVLYKDKSNNPKDILALETGNFDDKHVNYNLDFLFKTYPEANTIKVMTYENNAISQRYIISKREN